MADRSNYADKAGVDSGGFAEHRLRFGDENRAYTPSASETDSAGHFGGLAEGATGDPFWKPGRYRGDVGYVFDADEITQMYPDGYVPGVPVCTSARYQEHQALLEAQMPTFRGVPPSAAELYGRRSYSPA